MAQMASQKAGRPAKLIPDRVKTTWSTGSCVIVIASFALVILGTLLHDVMAWRPAPVLQGQEKVREDALRDAQNFWDGSTTRFIERQIALRSPTRSRVRPWVSPAVVAMGAWSSEYVTSGDDGWLYLMPTGLYRNAASFRRADRVLDVAALLRRRLLAAGIELIVLPVPEKSVVMPDALPAHVPRVRDLHLHFTRGLTQRGVPWVDLLKVWRSAPEEAYLRTDPHWAPLGAARAAEAVAKASSRLLPEESRAGFLQPGAQIWDAGNTLALSGIFSTEVENSFWTRTLLKAGGVIRRIPDVAVVDAKKRPLKFTDIPLREGHDILVLGTSFSHYSGFDTALAHYTGGGARVIAANAGELHGAVTAALASGFNGRIPRVLVWEFPVHVVFNPETNLERLDPWILPPGPVAQLVPVPAEWHGDLSTAFTEDIAQGAKPKDIPDTFRTRSGRFLHNGQGALSLRLQRSADSTQDAYVSAGSHLAHLVKWPSTVKDFMVPFLDRAPGDGVQVRWLVPGQPPLLGGIRPVGLQWDLNAKLAIEGGIEAPTKTATGWKQVLSFKRPAPVTKGSQLVIRFESDLKLEGPITLYIKTAQGEMSSLSWPKMRSDTLLVGDLRKLEGKQIAQVDIRHVGPPPAKAAMRVAVIPLLQMPTIAPK